MIWRLRVVIKVHKTAALRQVEQSNSFVPQQTSKVEGSVVTPKSRLLLVVNIVAESINFL